MKRWNTCTKSALVFVLLLMQGRLLRRGYGWQLKPLDSSLKGKKTLENRREVLSSFFVNLGVATAGLCTGAFQSPISSSAAAAVSLAGEGEQRMVFRQKPTAPIAALIPAIQQRLLLEAALKMAKDVKDSQTSSSSTNKQQPLEAVLPPLDLERGTRPSRPAQDAELLQKYNPATLLRGDLVRAAMNLYTTNLNYDNILELEKSTNNDAAYEITDPNWKKSYIRANDGLPEIQKVIGADLDLRYLYRNQVQLNIDDAAAELYYYGQTDFEEVYNLLNEAAKAFDLWLDRVRYGDVRDALEAALAGQSTTVYDTWAAGFMPPLGR